MARKPDSGDTAMAGALAGAAVGWLATDGSLNGVVFGAGAGFLIGGPGFEGVLSEPEPVES